MAFDDMYTASAWKAERGRGAREETRLGLDVEIKQADAGQDS